MTWTYKLDSDVFNGYFVIKDKEGDIIGPKEVMHWLKLEEMKPINHKLKEKLNSKKAAAAWFVSNCSPRSGRNTVAKKIKQELSEYNMTLDVFGECAENKCPHNETCWKKLENDYYFYLSFENSINDDYVTEKLLNALQHYTVPIVYGGANYTRFMPDGIYLNARTVTEKELVKKMVDIINNKEKYYDFFRWHNHYSYHNMDEAPEKDRLLNQLESYMDDLVDCFEAFVKKSMLVVSVAVGSLVLMVMYVLKLISERATSRQFTEDMAIGIERFNSSCQVRPHQLVDTTPSSSSKNKKKKSFISEYLPVGSTKTISMQVIPKTYSSFGPSSDESFMKETDLDIKSKSFDNCKQTQVSDDLKSARPSMQKTQSCTTKSHLSRSRRCTKFSAMNLERSSCCSMCCEDEGCYQK
ncbi:hypothetical protein PYW07_016998 [Mythimna separata]|uniref:Fucosyltransferase n=1 Tax=Mythimna separata TaxID=271217 RepID=A0AAD7YXR1_MYTSE|nr:hypothetical protein PYW07_016998 [Mythimna separata]